MHVFLRFSAKYHTCRNLAVLLGYGQVLHNLLFVARAAIFDEDSGSHGLSTLSDICTYLDRTVTGDNYGMFQRPPVLYTGRCYVCKSAGGQFAYSMPCCEFK